MNKVLFFGIHNLGYARNRVLAQGFEKNGFVVDHCRVDPRVYGRVEKFWRLYKLSKSYDRSEYAYVIVAFPGQTVVWLAWLLFGPSIIFDAHLSLYDSNVFDRRKFRKRSLGAFWNWFLDWHSCSLSKKVLLDTNEHISYFVRTFKISRSKFLRVLVGADTSVFRPLKSGGDEEKKFTVHFHGNFIPLQGVSYIIDAAKILKEKSLPIQFQFVGSGGHVFESAKQRASRAGLGDMLVFIGKVPFEEMPRYISRGRVCLGIFGNTEKSKRVIPNKVYECLAMGVPVLTAKTPAVVEVLSDRENSVLCKGADAEDLAAKIELLWKDQKLREQIGKSGAALFQQCLTPKAVVSRLVMELKRDE